MIERHHLRNTASATRLLTLTLTLTIAIASLLPAEAIAALRGAGKKLAFLTNDSRRSPEDGTGRWSHWGEDAERSSCGNRAAASFTPLMSRRCLLRFVIPRRLLE